MRRISLLLLSALLLNAQSPRVTPPRVTAKSDPEYTDEARRAHVSATVLLAVIVTAEGKATNVRVVRGVGFGLDEAAIKDVSTWRFQPGTRDGVPVNVSAQIEVNFRLLQRANHMQFARLIFDPPNTPRPELLTGAMPPASSEKGKLRVDFTLNTEGVPESLNVVESDPPAASESALEAIRQWRFTPPSQTMAAHFEITWSPTSTR